MKYMRRIQKILIILPLVLFTSCYKNFDSGFYVTESTQYNQLFNRKNGWTGADGAYSISLSNNKILWLYGDTWIGEVRDNKHVNSILVNNSIGMQEGIDPAKASILFFFGKTSEGKPDAFIKPDNKAGWFWMYDGLKTKKGLYLFLVQIDRTGDTSSPGFKIIGTWLGHVLNPHMPPEMWKLRQYKIPWEKLGPSGDIIFGSSVLLHNGFVYIYGTSENIINGIHQKFMILARVSADALTEFNSWRFYSNGNWVDNFLLASRICDNIANEYSISYLPVFNEYISVYTENSVSENIVIRTAPQPHGPWSNPVIIYKCPEVNWDEGIYCYAAKAHSTLTSAPDELIITYVANSNDFWKMAADARLYRPRFITVKFTGTLEKRSTTLKKPIGTHTQPLLK